MRSKYHEDFPIFQIEVSMKYIIFMKRSALKLYPTTENFLQISELGEGHVAPPSSFSEKLKTL